MATEIVIHKFQTDKEIFDFVGQPERVDSIRDKYPPPRYSCRIDPTTLQMIVTDHKEIISGDLIMHRG